MAVNASEAEEGPGLSLLLRPRGAVLVCARAPSSLHGIGNTILLRAQPDPVQPRSHTHSPAARSQVPCDEHSLQEWAVLALMALSAQTRPWGQCRIEQSVEALYDV